MLEIILKERPLRKKEVSSFVICFAIFQEGSLWSYRPVCIRVVATGEEWKSRCVSTGGRGLSVNTQAMSAKYTWIHSAFYLQVSKWTKQILNNNKKNLTTHSQKHLQIEGTSFRRERNEKSCLIQLPQGRRRKNIYVYVYIYIHTHMLS